jgi:hypothetical protein
MHERHNFYQPFDKLLNAHVFFWKIYCIFLSKRRFDDLGGEHLKVVPFTTESLLCSTKVGKFNIIMFDVIIT